MKKYFSGFMLMFMIFLSCTGPRKTTLNGIYQGVLPCADCPGIDYQLILKNDHTYSEKMIYQNRHVPAILDSGVYSIKNDTILQLKNNPESTGMRQFVIRDSQLTMLDMNGQLIHSGFADRYILKPVDPEKLKQKEELSTQLDGRWKLKSINNEPLANDVQIPWIELNVKQNRFFGFGGCNRINGEISFSSDSIHFGRIISTKMACLNNNIEDQFLRTFRNQNWAFNRSDSTLMLVNSENRLEFTEEK
ncbi:MAG TPA: copper resistance protein NlpE N-terminal domain-containing protein [Sunxiuqinia sp.]|nr:copper resistance protein NlpE N-terminal domain-containing protein [Sunxiuqinia sp.]